MDQPADAFSELELTRAWGDGGRRRHPGGDVHRQPAGRDVDPVRGNGRDRVPLHLRHLHRAVLQVHPGREAVYLIEGLLLQQESKVRPGTIHADTQGQSFPAFALAHLFGFDLMPRIRN
jgi:hypothetical protein